MKLNMGCGNHKVAGWVNVDLSPTCAPDVVCDLEVTPWPWADDTVTQVLFNHSLEHLGGNPRTFLAIIKELYRVCRNGAEIQINVPHPRHDTFINDPTHVRIITPDLMTLFNRELNDEWQRTGVANTPLAQFLAVDFAMTSWTAVLSEPYASQYGSGELSDETVISIGRDLTNVFLEYRLTLAARKP